jgi:hypothetical protein
MSIAPPLSVTVMPSASTVMGDHGRAMPFGFGVDGEFLDYHQRPVIGMVASRRRQCLDRRKLSEAARRVILAHKARRCADRRGNPRRGADSWRDCQSAKNTYAGDNGTKKRLSL